MSKDLLAAIGGLVTDHTFRDAVFDNFDFTVKDYGITDKEVLARLSKFVNGAGKDQVRHMLTQLEPHICGGKLDNCEEFKKIPPPAQKMSATRARKKKRVAKKKATKKKAAKKRR